MSRLWGIKSCSLDLSSDIDQSESLAGVTKREGRKKGEERSEIERCLIWATDCQAMMILELPGHQYCGSSLSLECDKDEGFRKTSTHLRTRYTSVPIISSHQFQKSIRSAKNLEIANLFIHRITLEVHIAIHFPVLIHPILKLARGAVQPDGASGSHFIPHVTTLQVKIE